MMCDVLINYDVLVKSLISLSFTLICGYKEYFFQQHTPEAKM